MDDIAELKIGGAQELRPRAWSWATAIIAASISDANALRSPLDIPRLVLVFGDVRNPADPIAFTEQHAQQLLSFVRALTPEARTRVLVHCSAGINRAPALAAGALCATGVDATDAWSRVMEIRPNAKGNPLVILRTDDALGGNRKLWTAWARWAHQAGRWPFEVGSWDRGASTHAIIERIVNGREPTARTRPRKPRSPHT